MVQWMKDGNVIDNDTTEPNNDIYASNTTLSNIDASDAGIYSCKAVVGNSYYNEYIVSSNIVTASFDLSVISE